MGQHGLIPRGRAVRAPLGAVEVSIIGVVVPVRVRVDKVGVGRTIAAIAEDSRCLPHNGCVAMSNNSPTSWARSPLARALRLNHNQDEHKTYRNNCPWRTSGSSSGTTSRVCSHHQALKSLR